MTSDKAFYEGLEAYYQQVAWRRKLELEIGLGLTVTTYRTHPHRWGDGKTHHVGMHGDRTLCGTLFSKAPGDLLEDVDAATVDCRRCITSATTEERHKQRNTELAAADERWWARYHEYMASPEWRAKRAQVLKRSNGRCETPRCSRRADQVHHLTYVRLGDELLDDLRAICMPCHRIEHPHRWIDD